MPKKHTYEYEHHCLVERPRPRKRKPKAETNNPFYDIHQPVQFASVCFNRKFGLND